MNEDTAALQQLTWAVQALAASADDQVRLFPPSVCTACELLSDFQNWFEGTRWRSSLGFTASQLEALTRIAKTIESMEVTPCYAIEELKVGSDWKQLRAEAVECLCVFSWPINPPPRDRSTYVEAG